MSKKASKKNEGVFKIGSDSLMKEFAKSMAEKILSSRHAKNAAVLALEGDLGSGKTTFAQGFARALGVEDGILSPTFIIFRHYPLQLAHYKSFYHVDAYRLKNESELVELGFKNILSDPKNIVLIEWADRVKNILPADALWLRFYHGATQEERIVKEG